MLFEFRCQQTKCGDGREIHPILYGDELGVAVDRKLLRRIQFRYVEIFIDRFRFYVVFRPNLGDDFVPCPTRDDDPDELLATTLNLVV